MKLDKRFSIEEEKHENGDQIYIVNFCGEYVGWGFTKYTCMLIALDYARRNNFEGMDRA